MGERGLGRGSFRPLTPDPSPPKRGRGEIIACLPPCIGARHAFAASGFAFHRLFPGSESMAPKFNFLLRTESKILIPARNAGLAETFPCRAGFGGT